MSIDQALDIVLQKIKCGQDALLKEAEAQTTKWEQENLTPYLYALCGSVLNPSKDLTDRVLSGILLKNIFTAKDPQVQEEKAQRWIQGVPEETKQKIKEGLLSLLATNEPKVRNIAAQIVSALALVEIPKGRWNDLIPNLLSSTTNHQTPPSLKQAALDCIGYLCEGLTPEVVGPAADHMLTAIVHGLIPEETSIEVKRSACTALYNALDFCRRNFENASERDKLMSVILDATAVPDEEVQVMALSIIVEIAAMHYEKLLNYMQRIFKITLEAMSISGPTPIPENVTKHAIEFWCTICEEELHILEETDFSQEMRLPLPSRECQFYIKGALQYLVPVVTQTLTKQDDTDDPDEWTVSMAGGVCLALIAQTVEDDIVPHVMPFIESHIVSQDVKYKEAAILAFGSILEGPQKVIGTLITQATPVLLTNMKDPSTAVKDTTAWTIGRILKFHHKDVRAHAENILKIMGEALGDKPRVASNAAWAIHNLALSFQNEDNNPLAKYFNEVVHLLLVTSERDDAYKEHLRLSAYEALNVVLATAPPAANVALETVLGLVLDRLEKSFFMEIVSQDDQNAQNELQGSLCGVLQVITQKIEGKVKPHADRIMTQVLRLFKSKSDSGVYEEAFLTVAAIANVVDHEFMKYMPEFNDHLCTGLANWQEYQVCAVAVGVVGDIARALGVRLAMYCDRIITLLLQALQNRGLDRSVKPPILSCFGDIALSIGGAFEKYMDVVMNMLKQAAETVVKTNLNSEDYDLIEYMNSLREGIFEAYTGIIQGLRTDKKGELITPHVSAILTLVHNVSMDQRSSESVQRCAVGICGDLALALGHRIKNTFQQPFLHQFISQTLERAESEQTKETAEWAREVISAL